MGPFLSGSKESCRAYLDAHSTSGIEIKGVFWLDSFLSARRRWVAVPTLTSVINLINNNMMQSNRRCGKFLYFCCLEISTRSRSSLILNFTRQHGNSPAGFDRVDSYFVISLFRYTFSIQNTLLQQCRVYHQPPSIFFLYNTLKHTSNSSNTCVLSSTPGGYLFLCFLSPPLPFPFPPRFLFL
jgi:hypothetical protein